MSRSRSTSAYTQPLHEIARRLRRILTDLRNHPPQGVDRDAFIKTTDAGVALTYILEVRVAQEEKP